MTSQIKTHTEYLIQTQYSCAHFILETDGKYSLNGGF